MVAPRLCAPRNTDRPFLSVVTPTWRRPRMLRRALESVRVQGFDDWELIISDDDSDGDAARIAWEVFCGDPRARVITNHGEHGQAGNMNNALRAARGRWVKPLFDDDALKPGALERFSLAAERCPGAAIVRCLTDRVFEGRLRAARRGRRANLEVVRQRDAHLAMYLQDLDIGTPTSVLVNRRAIDAGALFEEPPGISSSVDGWWFVRCLRHGDLALLNEALVEIHQGAHETVTSETGDDERYEQFELLRQWLAPMIPLDLRAPDVGSARAMIRLIRAACDVSHGRVLEGIRGALAERDPVAWRLAARWALRRTLPGRFEAITRRPVRIPSPDPPLSAPRPVARAPRVLSPSLGNSAVA